jgi:hypothetical protein
MSYLVILHFASSTTHMHLYLYHQKNYRSNKKTETVKFENTGKRHCPPRGYQPLQMEYKEMNRPKPPYYSSQGVQGNTEGERDTRNEEADGVSGRFRVAERRSHVLKQMRKRWTSTGLKYRGDKVIRRGNVR